MQGFPLFFFHETVQKLKREESLFPISVREKLVMLPAVHNNPVLMDMVYEGEWKEIIRSLPLPVLQKIFSFEEIVRMSYDNHFFFTDDVKRGVEKTPSYRIFEKIKSSFWRWGKTNDQKTWGTAVKVYDQLRSFVIPNQEFSVSIDWTTGFNEHGYSESARIYLDGVFAYLIHYRGKHVMTVGFSFRDNGDLLIQQIQLVEHKGNRFLYKLPSDYMKWIITILQKHFKGRRVYMIDGESLASKIYNSYRSKADYFKEEFKRKRAFIFPNMKEESRLLVVETLRELCKSYKAYWQRAVSFKLKDFARIVTIYRRARGECTKKIRVNNLQFWLLSKKPTV